VTVLWAAGLLLLAVLAAAGARKLRMIAAAGSGYKAKIACSALFVSRLPLDPNAAPEVADDAYKILRLFRARADLERRTVTASLLGLGPGARTAVYRDGTGATLVAPGAEPRPVVVPAPAKAAPLPRGGPAPSALEALLDESLTEVSPSRLRRTRALVILKDGRLVAERYAPGYSPETPLNGWSMGKSVLGALIGAAVGRGALALDQKGLLPQWRGAGDPRAAISLEDLLRMRGGLRFAEKYADPASEVVQMLFARDDAGAFAASCPLAHPPGTRWQYSSGTTNILSLILRLALGDAEYHAFPRRALFDPLGMETALMEPDASGTFVGSSFTFACARDWARFGQLFMQDGVWEGRRLLPEGWVRFSTMPTPQAPDARYGAHWWLKLQKELGGETPEAARIPPDAFHALGHEGQCLTVIPSRGLVAVRLGMSIYIDAWNHAAFLARLLDAL
jgi:CubicO group peptidase (beta-lactamase class C family)